MGKEGKITTREQEPEIYSGPYQSIGWLVGGEPRLRWQRGLQFGSRTVSWPYVIDLEGNKHVLPMQRGPITWYDWRFRRVEGLEEKFPPPVTLCFDEEKTTIGIELENRSDAVTPLNKI